jgi:hypothetical protein
MGGKERGEKKEGKRKRGKERGEKKEGKRKRKRGKERGRGEKKEAQGALACRFCASFLGRSLSTTQVQRARILYQMGVSRPMKLCYRPIFSGKYCSTQIHVRHEAFSGLSLAFGKRKREKGREGKD